MFCMHCGTKLPDGAAFCYACGQKTTIPQQETKKPDPAGKTLEEVLMPDVIEHLAGKMAEKLNADPIRRYYYLLRDYEKAAQEFVSDEIMQEAIKLANELDKLHDTTILTDPEIKKMRPVLYLYRGAMSVWQHCYHRWEADTNARKHNDTQQDFASLAMHGTVKFITPINLSENSASAIYGHMGLRVWLEFRLLTDIIYFLLKQGYKLSEGKRLNYTYERVINRYDMDLVNLATDQALKRYKSS